MKYLTITLLFSTVVHWNFGDTKPRAQQKPPTPSYWDSTTHWKIYHLTNFNRVFRTPIDSLSDLVSRPLNDDSIHEFLSDAKKLPATTPVWMGCYLASYQTPDRHTKKAIISVYGGFFFCQLDNTYFQLETPRLKDWLNYLSQTYVAIDAQ